MRKLQSEALLILTAAIWGLAFVAQRKGMQYLDPLLFNGIRFALGAIIIGMFVDKAKVRSAGSPFPWLLGIVLFIAASLQQIGIVYTSAGNAGFITGLYIVFVPLLGIFRKQRLSKLIMVSILLSVSGLYLINVRQPVTASLGNLLVLVSAVFWALHVQLIDKYTQNNDTFTLATGQFSICAVLSVAAGIVWHLAKSPSYLLSQTLFNNIGTASLTILYGGLFSVGIAYTLQVHAQKHVPPAPATIILCLEGVFALLGGWLILKETLSAYILMGAALLLTAMLLSVSAAFRRYQT